MYIELGRQVNKETESKRAPKTSNLAFEKKLEKKEFDKFTASDIVTYFNVLYEQVNGCSRDYSRGHAESIVKELLDKGFDPVELVENIDFVLLSDQTRFDKEKFGLGLLKLDDVNEYIDAHIEKYLNGQSVSSKPKKVDTSNINRKREWCSTKDGIAFKLPKF